MKINVHGGHNSHVTGAARYLNELQEDRKVKDLVINKLKKLGHTVYDCTDDAGSTQAQNLRNIVTKCNAHSVDLDVSIHFNAGGGIGTEVYVYSSSSKALNYAKSTADAIAELGFKNRGVKYRTNLYVLKHTASPAMLVECCFVDSEADAQRYNAEKMANAIVKGITGQTVSGVETSKAEPTPAPTPAPTPTKPAATNNLTVDGKIGKGTIQAFQKKLGTTADGFISGQLTGCKKYWPAICANACSWNGGKSQFVIALQKMVGTSVDGLLGKGTAKALQQYLTKQGFTCSADGIFGTESAKALQKWLNK